MCLERLMLSPILTHCKQTHCVQEITNPARHIVLSYQQVCNAPQTTLHTKDIRRLAKQKECYEAGSGFQGRRSCGQNRQEEHGLLGPNIRDIYCMCLNSLELSRPRCHWTCRTVSRQTVCHSRHRRLLQVPRDKHPTNTYSNCPVLCSLCPVQQPSCPKNRQWSPISKH